MACFGWSPLYEQSAKLEKMDWLLRKLSTTSLNCFRCQQTARKQEPYLLKINLSVRLSISRWSLQYKFTRRWAGAFLSNPRKRSMGLSVRRSPRHSTRYWAHSQNTEQEQESRKAEAECFPCRVWHVSFGWSPLYEQSAKLEKMDYLLRLWLL